MKCYLSPLIIGSQTGAWRALAGQREEQIASYILCDMQLKYGSKTAASWMHFIRLIWMSWTKYRIWITTNMVSPLDEQEVVMQCSSPAMRNTSVWKCLGVFFEPSLLNHFVKHLITGHAWLFSYIQMGPLSYVLGLALICVWKMLWFVPCHNTRHLIIDTTKFRCCMWLIETERPDIMQNLLH